MGSYLDTPASYPTTIQLISPIPQPIQNNCCLLLNFTSFVQCTIWLAYLSNGTLNQTVIFSSFAPMVPALQYFKIDLNPNLTSSQEFVIIMELMSDISGIFGFVGEINIIPGRCSQITLGMQKRGTSLKINKNNMNMQAYTFHWLNLFNLKLLYSLINQYYVIKIN